MPLIKCPECDYEILARIGTICPNCGHTVSYFEGDKNRKRYGKFFALSLIIPFFSFAMILLTSPFKSALTVATVVYVILAYMSSPLRYKEIFFTTFEKIFFWSIWLLSNALLVTMLYNLFNK
ncbi:MULTISPECIES: hypothetical protein [Malaciobacter]|jgi:hypothetical protein|uniref:Zinc ribbon domain-containing protein n=1 Tax=Malaciobacter canalis TaxID=1912871 RepID=A0ABX4LNL8_9BACT|nr:MULTISPECIES: hypothetical protein [Malaciobacter]PHO09492.1 hypothetical protein CPG37_09450 [Malaciobacter canalis]QEE33619.1 putative membrane protein [Malaciobacter canalis]SKB58888.1 hypothetical protein SAMN06295997_1225 [Malaciobacter marinus]